MGTSFQTAKVWDISFFDAQTFELQGTHCTLHPQYLLLHPHICFKVIILDTIPTHFLTGRRCCHRNTHYSDVFYRSAPVVTPPHSLDGLRQRRKMLRVC